MTYGAIVVATVVGGQWGSLSWKMRGEEEEKEEEEKEKERRRRGGGGR